jgi:hypothetical protein
VTFGRVATGRVSRSSSYQVTLVGCALADPDAPALRLRRDRYFATLAVKCQVSMGEVVQMKRAMRVAVAVVFAAATTAMADGPASAEEPSTPSAAATVAQFGRPIPAPDGLLGTPVDDIRREGCDRLDPPPAPCGPPPAIRCWQNDITMVSENSVGGGRFRGMHYIQWCGNGTKVTQVSHSCDGQSDSWAWRLVVGQFD